MRLFVIAPGRATPANNTNFEVKSEFVFFFAKDFFGVKNAPPEVLHFCPTFGVHFIHETAIPVAAKALSKISINCKSNR